MKRYTIKVTIVEGSDEFWEDINSRKSTGCDEVMELVRLSLGNVGFDDNVQLVKFEDDE